MGCRHSSTKVNLLSPSNISLTFPAYPSWVGFRSSTEWMGNPQHASVHHVQVHGGDRQVRVSRCTSRVAS